MGKRTRGQRTGRGYYPFKVGKKHKLPSARIPNWPEMREGPIRGRVLKILPGRNSPLALVKLLRSKSKAIKRYMLSPEGLHTERRIEMGKNAELKVGNVKHLKDIPEGVYIYNIERHPMDGGQIARSSGTYAIINEHDEEQRLTKLELPGRRRIQLDFNCRAQIGVAAGTNRRDLPLLKAGNAARKHKVRSGIWPRTSATAMNAVDHPFGGGDSVGRGKTVSRNAPPGQKVGSIAAKRSGKKKE